MSCNHCGTRFNFFHKEVGCPNCGLSFCNKCLSHKYKKHGKTTPNEVNVCKMCSAKTEPASNHRPPHEDAVHYPDTYYKRIEALERVSANNGGPRERHEPTASAADQLASRLRKLKGATKTPPTEEELRRRLANLKDQNDYVEGPSSKPTVAAAAADARTDRERVDSLLEMFMKEREIDLAQDPEGDIVARLASLRDQGVRPNEGAYLKNLHDSSGSEEEVDRITRKIMDEVALDERAAANVLPAGRQPGTVGDRPDSPELPWCVLCNADARFRCLDCGDLYCAECSGEVHRAWGESDHRVVAYRLTDK